MSVSEIQGASLDVVSPARALEQQTPINADLYRTVVDSLGEISDQMAANQEAVVNIALGDVDNLHQIIVGMERTRLSFEILMSVRNRALEAYQELMRMQL